MDSKRLNDRIVNRAATRLVIALVIMFGLCVNLVISSRSVGSKATIFSGEERTLQANVVSVLLEENQRLKNLLEGANTKSCSGSAVEAATASILLPEGPSPPQPVPQSVPMQSSSHIQSGSNNNFVVPDLDGEVFAGCLLTMDENMKLGEWVAYHFFTLPLRRLVVTIDPLSNTIPNAILDKWKPFINISYWNDDMFMNEKWLARAKVLQANCTMEEKRKVHRQRQSQFYRQCARTLKRENYTWTAFHDVDEYIGLDSHRLNQTADLISKPGSVLRYVKHVRHTEPENEHMQKICITIPRNQFGAKESSTREIRRGVPRFIDPKQFNTLRYRHSARHGEHPLNRAPKSIVDVSQVPDNYRRYEVHRPVASLCSSPWVTEHELTIHHYVGSWEAYWYRDDARKGSSQRSREDWESKASVAEVRNNDDLRPWVKGFVNYVGESLAQDLLQDIGPPVNLTAEPYE